MATRFLRLTVLIVLAAASSASAQAERLVQDALARADAWKRSSQLDQADQEYRRALDLASRLLGEQHPLTAYASHAHGDLFERRGKFDDALKCYARSLRIYEQIRGAQSLEAAGELASMASVLMELRQFGEAEKHLLRALAIREKAKGAESTETADSLNDLGVLAARRGQSAEAEKLHRKALAIREKVDGPESLKVAQTLTNLGLALHDLESFAAAEESYRKALAIRQKLLGAEHPVTAETWNNLALLLRDQGRFAEAERANRTALKIREEALGADHHRTAATVRNLAVLCADQGRYAESAGLYRRALASFQKSFGPEHLAVAETLASLAMLEKNRGRYAVAEQLLDQALAIATKLPGGPNEMVAAVLTNQAVLAAETGRDDAAEQAYRQAGRTREAIYGPHHPMVAASLAALASFLSERGRHREARDLYEKGLRIREKIYGMEHPALGEILVALGQEAARAGDRRGAETYLRRNLTIMERAFGEEHGAYADARIALANLQFEAGQHEEAARGFRQGLTILEKVIGREHPQIADAAARLGDAERAQKRYDAAQQAHQKAREIYQKLLGPDNLMTLRAIDQLAVDAWLAGRPGEALALYDEQRRSVRRFLLRELTFLPEAEQRQYLQADQNMLARALTMAWESARSVEPPEAADSPKPTGPSRSADNPTVKSASPSPKAPQAKGPPTTAEDVSRSSADPSPGSANNKGKSADAPRSPAGVPDSSDGPARPGRSNSADGRASEHAVPSAAATAAAEGARRAAEWLLNSKNAHSEARLLRRRLERTLTDSQLRHALAEVQDLRTRELALLQHEGTPATMNARRLRADLRTRRRLLEQTLITHEAVTSLFRPWIAWEALRDALPPDAVFVDIVRLKPAPPSGGELPPRYLACVISPRGGVRCLDLGLADPIDAAVQKARQTIAEAPGRMRSLGEARAEQEARAALQPVADLIWKPLVPLVQEARSLIISPDGELWSLPWSALPHGDKYLIETQALRLVVSGRDLLQPAKPLERPSAAMLVIDPDAQADPGSSIPDLVNTEAVGRLGDFQATFVFGPAGRFVVRIPEGDVIGQGIWRQDGDTVVMETEKSMYVGRITGRDLKGERRFKDGSVPPNAFAVELGQESSRVVGTAQVPVLPVSRTKEDTAPIAAAVRKALGNDLQIVAQRQATEGAVKLLTRPRGVFLFTKAVVAPAASAGRWTDPLTRVALVLAGGNRRGSSPEGMADGLLTAEEIALQDWSGAALVLLGDLGDACPGEASASLRHACHLAGARATLVPLWPQDDALRRFLTTWDGKLSADEIVGKMQVEILAERRQSGTSTHPYFWAGLTATRK